MHPINKKRDEGDIFAGRFLSKYDNIHHQHESTWALKAADFQTQIMKNESIYPPNAQVMFINSNY